MLSAYRSGHITVNTWIKTTHSDQNLKNVVSVFGDSRKSGINYVAAALIRPPPPRITTGGAPSISHGVRDAGGTLRLVGGQLRATTTALRTNDCRKADIGCLLYPRKRKSA